MTDPFVGTWTLNPSKSKFDASHQPAAGTMHWKSRGDGKYLMLAEGLDARGERVRERPQELVTDGRPYPVEGFAGLVSVTTRPAPNVIHAEARREDGTIAGEGSYVVSEDGLSLTATTAGFDSQLRRFEMRTVWEKTGD